MAVENFAYINSLDPNLPAAGDNVFDGDDHIRGVKLALRNQFPNLGSAPVTASAAQLSNPFPIGGIIMWSGQVADIPTGWCLCDGRTIGRSDGSGTIAAPNLIDRFVVCAGSGYGVGATGGATGQTINTSAVGDHAHAANTDVQGVHKHGGSVLGTALSIDQIPSHNHGFTSMYEGFGPVGLYNPSSARAGNTHQGTEFTGGGQAHAHEITTDGGHAHNVGIAGAGAHTHTVTLSDSRPPFYALAMIMRY